MNNINIVNEIIIEDNLIDINNREIIWNLELLRKLGLYIIYNIINNQYEIMFMHDPFLNNFVMCLNGKTKNLTNDNVNKLIEDINNHIVNQETSCKIWSNSKRKPIKRTIK